MNKEAKFKEVIKILKKASNTIALNSEIIDRHVRQAGLGGLLREEDPNKVEVGNIYKVLGHCLKVTSIKQRQHGKIVNLNCYAAGCCTAPFIMHMACSEKDVRTFKRYK